MNEFWAWLGAVAPPGGFSGGPGPKRLFCKTPSGPGCWPVFSCGIMGSYVVARRISYIAGAIAHCVLGGMGAAGYARGRAGLAVGPSPAGRCRGRLVGGNNHRPGQPQGQPARRHHNRRGVGRGHGRGHFVHRPHPGLRHRPNGLSFRQYSDGYPPAISGSWLGWTFLSPLSRCYFTTACWPCALTRSFARFARALRTDFYYMLLLCLTAMTVVLLSTVVGIIMVIALLTLPAGSASVFCRRPQRGHGLGRAVVHGPDQRRAVSQLWSGPAHRRGDHSPGRGRILGFGHRGLAPAFLRTSYKIVGASYSFVLICR